MTKPDCKKCYKYEERLAIIVESGVDYGEALKLARKDTCKWCAGERGLGLFD